MGGGDRGLGRLVRFISLLPLPVRTALGPRHSLAAETLDDGRSWAVARFAAGMVRHRQVPANLVFVHYNTALLPDTPQLDTTFGWPPVKVRIRRNYQGRDRRLAVAALIDHIVASGADVVGLSEIFPFSFRSVLFGFDHDQAMVTAGLAAAGLHHCAAHPGTADVGGSTASSDSPMTCGATAARESEERTLMGARHRSERD